MKNVINFGENFHKKNSLDYVGNYDSLRDIFGSYSREKENIYNYYYELLVDNCDEVIDYGIRSFSRFFITLESMVKKGNKTYYLVITKSYNWYKELD